MDLSSIARELPAYEGFIRQFRAPEWLRSQLAVDHDDVRAECRWRAYKALVGVRERHPALVGTIDEKRIVRRSIARAFTDMLRKGSSLSRCMNDTAYGTIHSGVAAWCCDGTAPSVEDEALEHERAAAYRKACEQVRRIVDDPAMYADLMATYVSPSDRKGDAPRSRREIQAASDKRRAAIAVVRRRLPVQTVRDAVSVFGGSMSDINPADLTDDNLARVALVYRDAFGTKVEKADRAHLLEKVTTVNSTAAGPFPFPPCFGTGYDEAHPDCKGECDFRRECRSITPQFHDPKIEAALVTLKGGPVPVAQAKAPKTPKPPAEPKATPAAPALPPVLPEAKVETPKKAPVVLEAPKAEKTKVSKPKAEKVKTVQKTAKKAPVQKVKAEKKAPAKKAKADKPRGRTVLDKAISISGRPGIDLGKNARPRIPQGSAAELAALPVGTVRDREYNGVKYTVKKIKDGVTVVTPGGAERKRDGVWRLVGPKPTATPPVEGSLGVITRFITGANTWSAARFWSIVPSVLDPSSPDFDPKKFKPDPVYAYAGKAQKAKAKKKARANA